MEYRWFRRYPSCRRQEFPVPQLKIPQRPQLHSKPSLATGVLPEHSLDMPAFEIHRVGRAAVKQYIRKKALQTAAKPFIHRNGKAVLGFIERALRQNSFKGFL